MGSGFLDVLDEGWAIVGRVERKLKPGSGF
jgi:hypothetical protein